MNRKLITKTISGALAELLYCEGYHGDIVIRVNGDCGVYKIIYNFVESCDPEAETSTVVEAVKRNYPDATSVTFHFRPGQPGKKYIGKAEMNFADKITNLD